MLSAEKKREIDLFSKQVQMETVKMIGSLGIGHIGGSLSIADLIAVLYAGGQMRYDAKNPRWEGRDWLVCSKGHAGPALYAALALRGFMPMEALETLNRPGTNLPSHCDRNRTPGIDMTTGSLGQGASSAAGIALGHKLNGDDSTTYLILGDGECDEGQVWEMALFAPAKRLSGLIAFVDYNKLQLDAPTEELIPLGDIAAKFAEFGWHTQDIDGHDTAAIYAAIERAKQADKPSAIVLNTVKGHGWSAIENKAGSHNMPISPQQQAEALEEMQRAMDALAGKGE